MFIVTGCARFEWLLQFEIHFGGYLFMTCVIFHMVGVVKELVFLCVKEFYGQGFA